jgi:hypothetical protein
MMGSDLIIRIQKPVSAVQVAKLMKAFVRRIPNQIRTPMKGLSGVSDFSPRASVYEETIGAIHNTSPARKRPLIRMELLSASDNKNPESDASAKVPNKQSVGENIKKGRSRRDAGFESVILPCCPLARVLSLGSGFMVYPPKRATHVPKQTKAFKAPIPPQMAKPAMNRRNGCTSSRPATFLAQAIGPRLATKPRMATKGMPTRDTS